MGSVKKRVEVHIGELVLHGLAPAQRRAVREAVEREVARRVASGGVPADGNLSLPEIRLGGTEK